MQRTHVQSSRLLHIRKIRKIASATLLVTAGTVLSFSAAAKQVPRQLRPHDKERLLVQVHAKADQVYTCNRDAAQFTWTLKAPDAQCFDKNGKPFGKLFPPGRRTTEA